MDYLSLVRKMAHAKKLSVELLESYIREAILAGYTYRQVAEAAGIGHSTIQRIMLKEKENV